MQIEVVTDVRYWHRADIIRRRSERRYSGAKRPRFPSFSNGNLLH